MISAKTFMKTYGAVGVGVYGSATVVNILGIYLALRTTPETMITAPLERVLGSESEVVQNIKKQLGDAKKHQQGDNTNNNTGNQINWVREGTYFGVATIIDSLVLPIKLAVVLPLTRQILKRRGR